MCLLKYWLTKWFKIPTECNTQEEHFYHRFFDSQLNILDCKFKLPNRKQWKGHPYYLDVLQTLDKLNAYSPKSFESVISIPLWFNKMLDTNFDAQLSKIGYNYVSDLFRNNVNETYTTTDMIINSKIAHLKSKIDPRIKNMILENIKKESIIYPFQSIRFKNEDRAICKMATKDLYKVLIDDKIRIPKGLLNWCLELELSDQQIKTALTFVSKCSPNIQDRVLPSSAKSPN